MKQYELDALVQNCIDAYNWIKEQIGDLDTHNVTVEDVKRVIKVPGYEYLAAFGEVVRTHEILTRLEEEEENFGSE